jgi:uncharacterized protein
MKPFSLLIKPASADCNLRCKYCFYIDHLNHQTSIPRMSEKTLELLIQSYMSTNQDNHYTFGWQGGEPTMMGLNFFRKVVEYQIKYAPPNAIIANGIQTNGTLLSEDWAKFFAEYRFLLGISLDGPEELHDFYRKTIGMKSTHQMVLRGINHLRNNNVEFNILCLVNNQNVSKAREIYHYFIDNEFYYHQYIPCVEFNEDGAIQPFSITGEQWGLFLTDLFKEWVKQDVNRVSIRLFDSIIEYLVYGNYNVCHMQDNCAQYFVIEYDGTVYPCDFFVRDDLLLGNIKTHSWAQLLNSQIFLNFGAQKKNWNSECDLCPYLSLCHGDCQKFRLGSPSNSKKLSTLCRGWKIFYTRTLPKFINIAEDFKAKNQIGTPTHFTLSKFGRNDMCPCGSRKKYKNCCGKLS